MTVEWSVSIGNILTILLTLGSFAAASIGFVHALKTSIAMTGERLQQMAGRMINVETELRELIKITATMAAQDQRMENHTQRMDAMDRSAQEWRTWVREKFDEIEKELRHRRG